MNNEELKKLRDLFRESADIIDEMLELEEKGNNGQDVGKEYESEVGRFAFKMIELQSISDK